MMVMFPDYSMDSKVSYITEQGVTDYSNRLLEAIKFSRTKNTLNGRGRLTELGLDSKSVAQKIISLYESII